MQKPYTSYNIFFLLPFIVWVIVGGVSQLTYSQEELFRLINGHHNSFLDVFMFYSTYLGEGIVIALTLLLLMVAIPAFRNWWYFSAAVLANVLPTIITQIIKRSVNAPRPLKVFGEADWVHSLPDWSKHMSNSFPSGHTCGAFCFFTFLSLILLPKHKYWASAFFVFALLVGYSRIYLAVHFFKDVYVGSIIGVVATLLIIALMNRYKHIFLKKAQ